MLLGEITHEDMWSDFCKDVGQEIDYQILIDSYIKTELDDGMFMYLKELKRTYKIGLITDNKVDRIDTILDCHNYREYFDSVAISAEQHSGKEDSRIFQYVLDSLDVKATECVFIDNTAKNLVAPSKIGMKTILFDDENRDLELFKNTLRELLKQE